jgi:hypothetical protein
MKRTARRERDFEDDVSSYTTEDTEDRRHRGVPSSGSRTFPESYADCKIQSLPVSDFVARLPGSVILEAKLTRETSDDGTHQLIFLVLVLAFSPVTRSDVEDDGADGTELANADFASCMIPLSKAIGETGVFVHPLAFSTVYKEYSDMPVLSSRTSYEADLKDAAGETRETRPGTVSDFSEVGWRVLDFSSYILSVQDIWKYTPGAVLCGVHLRKFDPDCDIEENDDLFMVQLNILVAPGAACRGLSIHLPLDSAYIQNKLTSRRKTLDVRVQPYLNIREIPGFSAISLSS